MAVRVIGLKIKEVFTEIIDAAMVGANEVMDKGVVEAQRHCPVGTITREDGRALRDVLFIPQKGRGKGKIVNFIADTWTGRKPGSLRATIRKVEKYDRRGNLRVYAGNQKVFYARFTEYGTASTGWGKGVPKQPFMRPAFQSIKGEARNIIESKMRKVPEVK